MRPDDKPRKNSDASNYSKRPARVDAGGHRKSCCRWYHSVASIFVWIKKWQVLAMKLIGLAFAFVTFATLSGSMCKANCKVDLGNSCADALRNGHGTQSHPV